MLAADFIQDIEDGDINAENAVLACIHEYRMSWSSIRQIAEVFEKIGESGTASKLHETLDSLDVALNEYYSIDMDGQIIVRPL